MYKTRFLVALMAAVAVLASGCSKKAPGEWALLDTGTGDAFYNVNFVNESVGWLNGQTDRSFTPYEEEGNANGNANRSARPKKPDEKKEEDPLKANQGFEVLQTTDGGRTWQQIKDQFKHKIRSVWFVDPQLGWALTIDRDILNTTDGGERWTLQRKAGTVKLKLFGNRKEPEMDQPEQIDRIYFIDGRHGWAWGGGRKDQYAEQPGVFLITVDGGQSWNDIAYPFEQPVSVAFFLDKDRAWASTEDGSFYNTGDGGLNWARVQTKLPEDVFRSIFFVDENNGWIVGRSGRMAKTTDGGRTWNKMYKIKDQYKMRDIFFADRNRGWAVGEGGAILYTPDGGDSWLDVSVPGAALLDVLFISPTDGWAAGLSGAVLKFQPEQSS
ncbi:MAG TPA: YCF48-related protein [Blastocatellia bacterium]|nr:YCF48-related protein [Blastocatellia bacterium]